MGTIRLFLLVLFIGWGAAAEASAGRIEIPAFPEVAMRIRRVLADDNCDAGKIARVVGAEPALAARLLHMANSAAFNPGRGKVTDRLASIQACRRKILTICIHRCAETICFQTKHDLANTLLVHEHSSHVRK